LNRYSTPATLFTNGLFQQILAHARKGILDVQVSNKLSAVYSLDPTTDPRWPRFLARHRDASIFHTREWLDAIRRTYGYEPIAFTTSDEEELSNAVVFCRISSWLTGRRLVSLPFSDHCQPLATGDELAAILHALKGERRSRRQKYIELRPLMLDGFSEAGSSFGRSDSFRFQTIDLRPDLKAIYSGFHESCVRRKIKRAEREELVYESGRSEELLKKFRHLLFFTRRRHKLPPQPAEWFRNIVNCLGEMATIHVVSKGETPVASIVTFLYKKTLVYKYGCSDGQFSNMGGTPLLFWKAVQQAKEAGAETFDLGRSDHDEPGLIAFKEHLGASTRELIYYRDPAPPVKEESAKSSTSASSLAREALVRLPDPLLAGVGQLLYRHIG
jgi:hypothetical protein